MDVLGIIRSQYQAALDMLAAAIEACPDAVWDRPEDRNRSWQVAYHALFYLHFYLQPTEADFRPWPKHREQAPHFDRPPWLPEGEYVASEGNRNIAFCLRGVKSHLGDPHRNLVDFAHVPVVKLLTRMPVCVDPSHSVGRRMVGVDGIQEIHHATAQGVIAGANMVLVDFHPDPSTALCDGPQALTLDELGPFLEDVAIVRAAYEKRRDLTRRR